MFRKIALFLSAASVAFCTFAVEGQVTIPGSTVTVQTPNTSPYPNQSWTISTQYPNGRMTVGNVVKPGDSTDNGARAVIAVTPGVTNNYYTNTTNTSGGPTIACTGTAPNSSQMISCFSPATGTIIQDRAVTCNTSTGTWAAGPWTNTSNSCNLSCTGTAPPNTQSISCTAPSIGTVIQSRPVSCDTAFGSWVTGSWTTTSQNCTGGGLPCTGTQPATAQTISCTAPQTGSLTQGRTVSCDGTTGSWIAGAWNTTATTCTTPPAGCPAASMPSATQSTPCAAPQIGSITETRTVSCNTATNTWISGTWVTTNATCTTACTGTVPPSTQSVSCTAPSTGTLIQTRNVSCNTTNGTYTTSLWMTQSGTCSTACPSPQPVTTQTVVCPSPQSGTFSQSRPVSCDTTSGTWITGTWGTTSSACIVPPIGCSAQTQPLGTQTISCTAPLVGTIGQSRSVTCDVPSSTWITGNWSTTTSSCTCNAATQPAATQTRACPITGQTGAITDTRSVTCNGDGTYSTGAWVQQANTCVGCPSPKPADLTLTGACSALPTTFAGKPAGTWAAAQSQKCDASTGYTWVGDSSKGIAEYPNTGWQITSNNCTVQLCPAKPADQTYMNQACTSLPITMAGRPNGTWDASQAQMCDASTGYAWTPYTSLGVAEFPSSGWTITRDGCTAPVVQTCSGTAPATTESRACGTGFDGNETFSRTVSCSSGNWTTSVWTKTASNCTAQQFPKSCWRAQGTLFEVRINLGSPSTPGDCNLRSGPDACYAKSTNSGINMLVTAFNQAEVNQFVDDFFPYAWVVGSKYVPSKSVKLVSLGPCN